MLKQILVVAGGLALAASLPLAALAVTTEPTPALDNYAVEASDEAPQPMVQQRLRVHAETGQPENFEPVRQRLHQPDGVGSSDQSMIGRQYAQDDTDGRMDGKNSSAPGPGPSERPRGNAAVPNGGGMGECPNDGEPSGAANRGPRGAGAPGQGGRRNA